MDYNRILAQKPVNEFMATFRQFSFDLLNPELAIKKELFMVNLEKVKNRIELYTYESEKLVRAFLEGNGIAYSNFKKVDMTLEDAFIGLTGKY
jgi:ABC-2 type transport system ATP-binding protein